MKKYIFDSHGGQINCDVCGNHTFHVQVWSLPGDKYGIARRSQCFGDINLDDISRDEVVRELDKARGMMHVRHCIQGARDMSRAIKRGKHAQPAEVKIVEPSRQTEPEWFLPGDTLSVVDPHPIALTYRRVVEEASDGWGGARYMYSITFPTAAPERARATPSQEADTF